MRGTDFIRLEQAKTDLDPIFAHLGFRFDLPIANASQRAKDWRPYYAEADATLIARLCAADITRSNYHFDPQA